MKNRLFYGDNLPLLRNKDYFPDGFVDLVYLDPPFNSNADYNVIFNDPTGKESEAQTQAFTDTWHWTIEIEKTLDNDIKIFVISAVTRAGCQELSYAMYDWINSETLIRPRKSK